MGSYWTLSINGFNVLEGKNSFDDRMLLLFRKEDAQIRVRKGHADEQPDFAKYQYVCHVSDMRGRLDLMGFTAARARADFEQGRLKELVQQRELVESRSGENSTDAYRSFLERYSFEKWVRVVRKLISDGQFRYIESRYPHVKTVKEFVCSYGHDDALLGFFLSDHRLFLRACLESAPPRSRVTLNVTDIINQGYVASIPELFEVLTSEAVEYARTTPVVILTEGTTDRWILEHTLPLVFPHLSGFFTFMDFDLVQAQGGAGHLVNVVKAFVGSGIKNRILALFDNDTAAHAALRPLGRLKLPPNIRALTLPVVEAAKSYPTVGPQGSSLGDINGSACSIEFSMGKDILGQGNKRPPVRWTGYDTQLKQYQGEVSGKRELFERFRAKVQSTSSSAVAKRESWLEIRQLWTHIKEHAELLSVEMTSHQIAGKR